MWLDKAKQYFQGLLLRRGRNDAIPSSMEDVQRLEKELGILLPQAYKEFLLWTGEGGGILIDEHSTRNKVHTNRERAIKCMRTLGVIEPLAEDAIVFVFEQLDTRFFYICTSQGDNPPVHMFEVLDTGYNEVKITP